MWNQNHGVLDVGQVSIVITLLMLGGIQLGVIGVIGEYIWRNSHESRRRSSFIVDSVIGRRPEAGGATDAEEE
jgi:hypothetical protein